jgi:hypothetical protein
MNVVGCERVVGAEGWTQGGCRAEDGDGKETIRSREYWIRPICKISERYWKVKKYEVLVICIIQSEVVV